MVVGMRDQYATDDSVRSHSGPGARGLSHPWWWHQKTAAVVTSIVLCVLHFYLTWTMMGGWAEIVNDWPLLQGDYGFHYYHGIISRNLLRTSGFSAGYDAGFMSGFSMSVLSGTSSTISNVAILLFGGNHPAVAFKLAVLASIGLPPVLVGWAAVLLGARASGVAWSILIYQIYFWCDFPINYASFGMFSFLLSTPLGLVAVGLLARYLDRGGWACWLGAAAACSGVFFVHVTSPMIVGPAGLAAYFLAAGRAWRGGQALPRSRHVGFWALAPVILALNAFWWLPGFWLRSTLGGTDFVFAHPEPVLGRLKEIVWSGTPVESLLCGLGLVGLVVMGSLRPLATAGLGCLIAAGFSWGYLAGVSRALDSFQPGRQTYAFYSGLCVAAGFGLGELSSWLRAARPGRFDRWFAVGFTLVGIRLFGPFVVAQLQNRVFAATPELSSRPLVLGVQLFDHLRQQVKPGDRLLFEETGFSSPGFEDRFDGRHFSPLIPLLTGAEVLGGPYLHTPVTTNFTQFGEGKLFEQKNWGRDQFVRYARLYRPSAIACWSAKAKGFCHANPDLVQVVVDDGVFVVGRVLGFPGSTIRGRAQVEATSNRLVVRDAVADADGLVVLRYHAVPCLVADPPVAIEPIYLEQDPVPFIGLRAGNPGPITIRMALPPAAGGLSAPSLGRRP